MGKSPEVNLNFINDDFASLNKLKTVLDKELEQIYKTKYQNKKYSKTFTFASLKMETGNQNGLKYC